MAGACILGCWSLSHGWHIHTWQLELLGLLQGFMVMLRVLCDVRAYMKCTYDVAAVLGDSCLVCGLHTEQRHSHLELCRQNDWNIYARYSINNVLQRRRLLRCY